MGMGLWAGRRQLGTWPLQAGCLLPLREDMYAPTKGLGLPSLPPPSLLLPSLLLFLPSFHLPTYISLDLEMFDLHLLRLIKELFARGFPKGKSGNGKTFEM